MNSDEEDGKLRAYLGVLRIWVKRVVACFVLGEEHGLPIANVPEPPIQRQWAIVTGLDIALLHPSTYAVIGAA